MRTSSTPHRCAYSILIVEESQSTPGYATLEPAGYSTDDLKAAQVWAKTFNRRELANPTRAWAVIATEPATSDPPAPSPAEPAGKSEAADRPPGRLFRIVVIKRDGHERIVIPCMRQTEKEGFMTVINRLADATGNRYEARELDPASFRLKADPYAADVLVIEGARPTVPTPHGGIVKRDLPVHLAESFAEGFNASEDRRPLCAVVVAASCWTIAPTLNHEGGVA